MLDYPILALARLIHLAISLYVWVIIARALLSWVNPDPFNPIVRFLYRATEPVLRPVRRRLSPYAVGIDFSPIVVILALEVIDQFLLPQLVGLMLGPRY